MFFMVFVALQLKWSEKQSAHLEGEFPDHGYAG